jgi:xanthine/uracil permease
MIRTVCTFLVLSCVACLSGLFTGHVWNRYADENGLVRLGGIYQRIVGVGAGLVEITQGYAAPATRSQLRPGASPFEE